VTLRKLIDASPLAFYLFVVIIFVLGVVSARLLLNPQGDKLAAVQTQLREQAQVGQDLLARNEMQDLKLQEAKLTAELLEKDLLSTRQKLLHAERDVAFYRGLISPEDIEKGLKLHSLTVSPMDQSGWYQYEIVIAQLNGQGRKLTGNVELSMTPEHAVFLVDEAGSKASDTDKLDEAAFQKTIRHRLGFRFFQRISGRLKLPEGYLPDTINLKATSTIRKGQGKRSLDEMFLWSEKLIKDGI